MPQPMSFIPLAGAGAGGLGASHIHVADAKKAGGSVREGKLLSLADKYGDT